MIDLEKARKDIADEVKAKADAQSAMKTERVKAAGEVYRQVKAFRDQHGIDLRINTNDEAPRVELYKPSGEMLGVTPDDSGRFLLTRLAAGARPGAVESLNTLDDDGVSRLLVTWMISGKLTP